MNVLLLDDDAAVRDILSRGLARFKHEVRAVASLEEARDALKTFKPDCAVLDMVLGTDLGVDLIPDLKLIDTQMPIIFITGNPDHAVFHDPALTDVIFSMLEKPVSLGRLKTIMEWAAEKRRESERPTSDQLRAIQEAEIDELKELVKTAGWKKIAAYVAFVVLLLSLLFVCFDAYRNYSIDVAAGRSYIDSFMDRVEGYLKRDEMRELMRAKDQRKLK
ncbi:MAG TPA: response regulator [Candidatus Ozemobacteraceae bacterium]|nr:response regulator [Candidatus Ozemobacteraceae bacterium]